jgi:zinc protease
MKTVGLQKRGGQTSCQTARRTVVTRLEWALVAVGLVALSIPLPALGQAQAPYPTSPPPAARLRPLRFPAFAKGHLPDSLQYIVVEQHKQPVVTVTLALPAGGSYAPADKTGLADIVAEVLTKGTQTRTADQIAAQIEGAGGSISAYADNDFLRITVSALSENLPLALDILSDVVMHPTFPATEVDLAKTRALSALQAELSDPGTIARRAFSHEVYGDYPYGRNYTAATLRATTREDVVAFYDAHVKPERALLVVAGDVSPAQVQRLAQVRFATWRGAPAPVPAFPPIPARTSTEIVLVHKPGAVQSDILAGFTMITPRDPAVYPLTIMNRILGGGADSRLFRILREQKSWTYDAHSQFTRPKGMGMFMASTEVRTPVTDSALAEMLHQLDRIRNEVPADSEITAAKNYLVGHFPLTIQTPEQIAGAVASARLLGLPDDYVPRFRDRLAAVTSAQLAAADKRYLTTDKMAIVVVGDGTKILDGLKKLGTVRIVDVEGKPMAEADLTVRASSVQWATDRLAPSSYTYRVMVQGNAMGEATSAMERAAEGDRPVFRLTSGVSLGGMVSQNDTVTVDAATLAPMHIRESGSQGGQGMSMNLDYQGTHLTGHVHIPTRQGVRDATLDTTLAEGTVDQNMFTSVLTALPLANGAKWTVNAYDGSEGTVRTLTASVTGEDSVTVPAGTFACWKLELTGGQFPINFYITKAAPYFIAKYELVGPPVVFELTAKTP